MGKKYAIKLFDEYKIRTKWDPEIEDYYYSVIDVIAVLTESKNPNNYWKVLKKRLKDEGVELVTICNQLKLPSPKDGKMYKTDVATTKQLLRLIQSVPSPKAEPFKQWLAQMGKERLEEVADPEIAMQRAIDTYRKKGYSEKWITQRMRSIETRKDLTAEWDRVGVNPGFEYAILTDDISRAWSGMSTKEYKDYKGLKKEGLKDNMTNLELILNMLAEVSTTEISKVENPDGFDESRDVAKRGGNIAGNAKREIEANTGKKVVSKKNSKTPELLDN
ncbi:Bro-N domain-containing protein [Methanobrevibacter sp.]|uniref:BRO-N domain-containing protein n=1 Tax=Methanobrevibacter sp. TaxID=66852 RepID=UPI00257C7BB3|nr:Bro-N domain-containing protein [Methanobrevibacter sp.]MBR2665362.1 Bro-N domain-containing protein [Methanobrevibacter sp.]MBR3197903.1 Bro-N domain-containing protein [Methanobrevibacter sp.]